MTVELIEGDCREVLKELDANSIDAIVTDPPYGLEFMGKEWDGADGFRRALNLADAGRDNAFGRTSQRGPEYRTKVGDMQVFQQWCTTWAVECLRVLKPGRHLLSFGGTRTYHRMASAIEDAGFEIRDQIGWLYGSGFPKSHNQHGEWEGWGTALKPAWDPIVMARKPLIGTVAVNLMAHGVGAINIDGCRVPFADKADESESKTKNQHADFGRGPMTNQVFGKFDKDRENYDPVGRWPANIIHDGSNEVLAGFPITTVGTFNGHRNEPKTKNAFGEFELRDEKGHAGSTGSAARYFYCAKASKSDRDDGVRSAPKPVVTFATANGTSGKPSSISEGRNTEYRNTHPTVKPTDLMRYLCRLVTPPRWHSARPVHGLWQYGTRRGAGGVQLYRDRNERRVFRHRRRADRGGGSDNGENHAGRRMTQTVKDARVCERTKRGEPNCFVSSDLNTLGGPVVGSKYGPCEVCYEHAPAMFDWARPSK